jgi:hypothetical protein
MTDIRQQLEDAWSSAENPQSTEQQEQTVATSEGNDTAPAEPVEVISAPNSYTKEAKDWFATLPHEHQKYLAEREKQFEQGLSRARNQYNWVDKVYNDRKDALLAQGYQNPQDYINDLVLISDALNKDPVQTLELLKQNYNVNAAQNQNESALQKQVQTLSQMVSQQQNYLQQQENNRVKSEYDAFVNAKDESGNLKHAYFDDVKEEMAKLFNAGLATNFEDAYNRAIWSVESVRNKIIADKTKTELANKVTEANKSKTAAFEPSSKNDGAPKELSLREELAKNLAIYGE